MRFECPAEWLPHYSVRGRCGVKDCVLRCADLNTIDRGCTWHNRGWEHHQRAKVFSIPSLNAKASTCHARSPRATFPRMKFPDDPTLAHQRHNDLMRSINSLYSDLVVIIVAGLLLAFSVGYLVG